MSCAGNEVELRVTRFPSTQKYAMEEVKTPELLMMPTLAFTSGKYLIVTQRRTDNLFYFFDAADCSFKFSAGKIGMGPNEFSMIDPRFYITTKSGFTILDAPNILKEIEVTDSDIEIKSTRTIPVNGITNNLLLLNDSTFCYTNIERDKGFELAISSTNGNTRYISPYPDWVKIDNSQKMFTYLSNNRSNPKSGRFVVCYAYFRKLKIFDANGKLLREITVDTPDTPEFNQKDRYIAYGSTPFTNEKYIYALSQNRRKSEELNASTEIHVFDWNGDPQAKWLFDKPFDIFTISDDGKQLYAINTYDGSKIYRCSLPSN